jgi:PPK2 family polyphosphate:nucleotide phosphotransferase
MVAKKKDKLSQLHDFVQKYKVTNGKTFKLSDHNPADTGPFGKDGKEKAELLLAQSIEVLAEKQEMLYAQDRYAMLLVFQAMDAAGKDGTIKHVMSGINPQGCQVFSFKQPSDEELDHVFLWRYASSIPERGRIGIFNRSYYEEVLVVRVHDDILAKQKLPAECITKNIWKERLEDINNFETHLTRNGVKVVKFFLNVSKKEQKKRFLARLDLPEKHWKFSASDITERKYWNEYMRAYSDAIKMTASKETPWFVVPADNKWFSRLVVGAAIVDSMSSMKLAFPSVPKSKMKELAEAKAGLLASAD